jgi:nucleotidyltransferase/DNA polymerase involved in DNA repair
MTTAVGHLDADCFYVSAERVRDAFLREKPVGVLGNQGACVIAKSYEMKTAGVGPACRSGRPWPAARTASTSSGIFAGTRRSAA